MYLYAANDPIIESSVDLKFAPYNIAYPKLDEQTEASGFDLSANKWDLIFDFTKREDGVKNYSIMDPSEFQIIEKELEEHGKPKTVFPYP